MGLLLDIFHTKINGVSALESQQKLVASQYLETELT